MRFIALLIAISAAGLCSCGQSKHSSDGNSDDDDLIAQRNLSSPVTHNVSSADPQTTADPEPAPQPRETVFKGLESGKLRCLFPGKREFTIDWAGDDGDGVVKLDGRKVQGTVRSEWAPSSNTIITYISDVKAVIDGDPVSISIDDEGVMRNDNEDSGIIHEGACRAI